MRISIITVTFNSEEFLEHSINSVIQQDYTDIEHIIIDGKSTDGTIGIIRKYSHQISKWVSEPDRGIYDAMNKGIELATGSIIGILNSDDMFYDKTVLSTVAAAFADNKVSATIADVVFVDSVNIDKVIRKYSSSNWQPSKFAWGYMPPHPSFFVKREIFEQFGYYKSDYHIAADYELLIRFILIKQICWKYLPVITTKMRLGGRSTNIKSALTLNREVLRACRENNISTNHLMIYSKYLFKPFEFLFHD